MEEILAPVPPQPANIDMSVIPLQPVKKSPWILIMSLLLMFALATAGYYYWQNTLLRATPAPNHSPSPTPAPTIDSKAGWQTYSNTEFVYQNKVYSGYSLAFPSTCEQAVSTLDCPLTHDSATIIINAGGHGGEPGNYEVLQKETSKSISAGSGVMTAVLNTDTNFVTGTFWINQTKLLTQESIFGFEFMHVPYQDWPEFEKLFDQILSTFQLIPSNLNEVTMLDTIQSLTTPMVWSKPVAGSIYDGKGNEVTGMLMTTKVGSKEENQLAQYLVTDTPIVTKYGWKETLTADGVGESLIIYAKNDQQLIIRFQNGQYSILLSN